MKIKPSTLFLDIDGTLLCRGHSGMFDAFELAPHCLEFLEWATTRYRCYWLSARCRTGFLDGSRRAFRLAGAPLSDPRWRVLNLIEPTAWSTSKTEALDATCCRWWWLDDDVSAGDREWLRTHGCADRLIEVSTDRDRNALLYVRSRLEGSM